MYIEMRRRRRADLGWHIVAGGEDDLEGFFRAQIDHLAGLRSHEIKPTDRIWRLGTQTQMTLGWSGSGRPLVKPKSSVWPV